MGLNLVTRQPPEPPERPLVPACLQARAPLDYEIRDEDDRQVPPTLAGYKLRQGTTYRLRVRTQEREVKSWRLRLLAPRSVAEPAEKDTADGDFREIPFETRAAAAAEPWKRFGSQVTSLPVHLDFSDGREPYRFNVPVVLLASRFRWLISLLVTAAFTYLSEAWFRERLILPTAAQLGLIGGVWALVLVICFLGDEAKFLRRARKLRDEWASPAAETAAPDPAPSATSAKELGQGYLSHC